MITDEKKNNTENSLNPETPTPLTVFSGGGGAVVRGRGAVVRVSYFKLTDCIELPI